jgi:hypothetical protein
VNGCPLNPNNLFPLVCKDAFKNNGIADALARRYHESNIIQAPVRDSVQNFMTIADAFVRRYRESNRIQAPVRRQVQSFMAIVDEVKESITDGAYMHISKKLKQMYDNADHGYDDSE